MKQTIILIAILGLPIFTAHGQDIPAAETYEVAYTLDEAGRLLEATWVDKLTTSYSYDAAGRLVGVVQEAISGVNSEPGPEAGLPELFALKGAYPNPFNPTTVIGYDLPVAASVELRVFDVLGRQVALLVQGHREAGRHEVRWNADALGSGTYLIRMDAGSQRFTRSVLLIR